MIISGEELLPLISKIKSPKGIEIGIGEGTTSHFLLSNKPDLTLYTIDPLSEYIDWNGNVLYSDGDVAYHKINSLLSPFQDRWIHYRETSDKALERFEDNKFDFVFIDGLHEYEQVLLDCKNYWNKIKSGGIFSGHDFKVIECVGRAVREFSNVVKSDINYLPKNDVWWWYKN